MTKPCLIVSSLLMLSACSSMMASNPPSTVARQDQLDCEQEALVAKSSYIARIKTPEYEVANISQSWAGSARSDSGEWVFHAAYKSCMQHAASEQP